MKAIPVIAIAIVVGCGIAFWLFAMAFNMSALEFSRQALIPLGFTFAVSAALTLVQPEAARSVVIALSLPTVLLNASFFLGTWDGGHVFTALALIGAATVGAWIGYVARRKGTGKLDSDAAGR